MKNIANHLDDDGLFSFSVLNPYLERKDGVLKHRGTKLTPNGEIISWFGSQTYDPLTQRSDVHYLYDISKQDKPLRRVTTAFTLRYLFYMEAVELLERCGLKDIKLYGDYSGAPFKSTSEMMVIVSRKA